MGETLATAIANWLGDHPRVKNATMETFEATADVILSGQWDGPDGDEPFEIAVEMI